MEFKVPLTLLKNRLFGFGSVHNIKIVITEKNSLLGTYSIFPHTEVSFNVFKRIYIVAVFKKCVQHITIGNNLNITVLTQGF